MPIESLPDIPNWADAPLVQFLLIASVAALLAFVVDVIGSRTVKRMAKNSRYDVDELLYNESHVPIFVTIAAFGLYYATIPLDLSPNVDTALLAVAQTVVVVVWARGLIRIGDYLREQARTKPGEKDFTPIFQNIWTITVLSGTLFAVLSFWNINITPLLASAGIAGIAVGFAAKDTVANFFGSIALYADSTYVIGDYITLESGHEGWVDDISIRSTVLRTRDDELVTVPNAELNAAVITNHSVPEPHHRIKVPVSVAYGSDLDHVQSMLVDIAEAHDEVLDDPEPRVRFRELGDNGLLHELICWSPSPDEMKRISHELLGEIYNRCNDEGIGMPYPQRDVHLHNASALGGVIGTEANPDVNIDADDD